MRRATVFAPANGSGAGQARMTTAATTTALAPTRIHDLRTIASLSLSVARFPDPRRRILAKRPTVPLLRSRPTCRMVRGYYTAGTKRGATSGPSSDESTPLDSVVSVVPLRRRRRRLDVRRCVWLVCERRSACRRAGTRSGAGAGCAGRRTDDDGISAPGARRDRESDR